MVMPFQTDPAKPEDFLSRRSLAFAGGHAWAAGLHSACLHVVQYSGQTALHLAQKLLSAGGALWGDVQEALDAEALSASPETRPVQEHLRTNSSLLTGERLPGTQ